jgi:hypothetical protein
MLPNRCYICREESSTACFCDCNLYMIPCEHFYHKRCLKKHITATNRYRCKCGELLSMETLALVDISGLDISTAKTNEELQDMVDILHLDKYKDQYLIELIKNKDIELIRRLNDIQFFNDSDIKFLLGASIELDKLELFENIDKIDNYLNSLYSAEEYDRLMAAAIMGYRQRYQSSSCIKYILFNSSHNFGKFLYEFTTNKDIEIFKYFITSHLIMSDIYLDFLFIKNNECTQYVINAYNLNEKQSTEKKLNEHIMDKLNMINDRYPNLFKGDYSNYINNTVLKYLDTSLYSDLDESYFIDEIMTMIGHCV